MTESKKQPSQKEKEEPKTKSAEPTSQELAIKNITSKGKSDKKATGPKMSEKFDLWTEDQVKVIKTLIAPGASDDELMLFMYICGRTKLDPFARQIYLVKRKIKIDGIYVYRMTPQTSIDGFRLIAERSGLYGGQDAPVHEYTVDSTGKQKLILSRITVHKFHPTLGTRYPAGVGEARYDEYVPADGLDFMYKQKPHIMLDKCAEALALRKAFPQDLSGLYTEDEMRMADVNSLPILDPAEVMQMKEDNMHKISELVKHPLLEQSVTDRVRTNWDRLSADIELQDRTMESLDALINKAVQKDQERLNKESGNA